jgi:methylthioxylose transferase
MSAAFRIVLIAAAVGLAASIGLLWCTNIPLGVPGEWTWLRIPFATEHIWGWIFAGFVAALYLGFVAFGSRKIESRGFAGRAVWIAVLAAAGFSWLITLESSVPGVTGLPKAQPVLFNWGSSGYFWQARYEVTDTRAFLAGYEDVVAQGDYLHIGTHPPGLTLLFRGLLALFESSPGLTDVVLMIEPESCRKAAAAIRLNAQASGRVFTPTDEAVLWFAALLAHLASAATVIPLFILLSECVDRRTAWFAAALWPLVPGIAVFLPKSDAVFPLFSILGPTLWLIGWQKRSFVLYALSGLTLFGGMLLSLAIAPIAVLTGLATVIAAVRERDGERRATLKLWITSVISAAVGFFVPVLLLWWGCDLNLPKVWSQNVTNHAAFYDHFTRTWWKWLLMNPLETSLAAGAPLAVAALVGGFRSRGTRLFPLVAATAAVWGLLWISGKNSGEAARLWLLFQPWMVVAAAGALVDKRAAGFSPAERTAGLNPAARERAVWLSLLALQAIACIATVTRVDGFELSRL